MPTCFMVASIADGFDDGRYRVGAMFWWRHRSAHPELDTSPRPQPHLAVMTAAGLACLDCPATGGNREPGRYWARVGQPPNVTVTPSLDIAEGSPDRWHGYLTDGVLTP